MVEAQPYPLEDDGRIPNNPLPLLVYQGAVAPEGRDPAATFERLFAQNGWSGSWRDGIFPYHHYHSTAHEVLGIARGRARVQFGGREGPVFEVAAGDVVVIPAGGGHCRLEASGDLLVVGAYPGGMDYDLCRDDPAIIEASRRRIAAVPLPDADPVAGADGPLRRLWRRTPPGA